MRKALYRELNCRSAVRVSIWTETQSCGAVDESTVFCLTDVVTLTIEAFD